MQGVGRLQFPQPGVRMRTKAISNKGQSFDERLDAALGVHRRSRALFERILTPKQVREFDTTKSFVVVGGVTGRRFRIHNCWSLNIEELDRKGVSHCAGPKEVCKLDFLVGQALWIQSDGELTFFAKANTRVSANSIHAWDGNYGYYSNGQYFVQYP